MKTNNMGLDNDETTVMDLLIEASKTFNNLPVQHPEEKREFTTGIHALQGLIAIRGMRRAYPKGWPTYLSKD